MIYHITGRDDWKSAINKHSYMPRSFIEEGFIHCSPVDKILQVANNFYKGRKDLVLLSIAESKVENKIIWENLYNDDFYFPHIYGDLNLDAVISVFDFECNGEGFFTLPDNFK